MKNIEAIVDQKRAAKIEYDRHGACLLVMNNGYQWSGASIYSIEVAKAAIEVLGKYVAELEPPMTNIFGYDIDGRPLRAGDEAIITANIEIYGSRPNDEGMKVIIIGIEPNRRWWHEMDDPCLEIEEPSGAIACIGAQSLRKLHNDHRPEDESFHEMMGTLKGEAV